MAFVENWLLVEVRLISGALEGTGGPGVTYDILSPRLRFLRTFTGSKYRARGPI